MIAHSRAFVLRTTNYRDSDVIVTLLGQREGRFGAIARYARSSKRRFGGSLLPLRVLNARVEFKPQRDLATLHEAEVVEDFRAIETSFERITVASYATELVRMMTRDRDEASQIFEVLHRLYEGIASCDGTTEVLESILCHFELSLLQASGAALSVVGCHRCGLEAEAMDRLRCTRNGEGLVCRDCIEERERYGVLEPSTHAVLRYLQAPGSEAPEAIARPETRAQVRRVLDASLARFFEQELKSRAMLDSILYS